MSSPPWAHCCLIMQSALTLNYDHPPTRVIIFLLSGKLCPALMQYHNVNDMDNWLFFVIHTGSTIIAFINQPVWLPTCQILQPGQWPIASKCYAVGISLALEVGISRFDSDFLVSECIDTKLIMGLLINIQKNRFLTFVSGFWIVADEQFLCKSVVLPTHFHSHQFSKRPSGAVIKEWVKSEVGWWVWRVFHRCLSVTYVSECISTSNWCHVYNITSCEWRHLTWDILKWSMIRFLNLPNPNRVIYFMPVIPCELFVSTIHFESLICHYRLLRTAANRAFILKVYLDVA